MLELLKKLLEMLQEFFESDEGKKAVKEHLDNNPKPRHFRNQRALVQAAEEIGQREKPGSGENMRIQEYHRYAERDNDKALSEEIPWCASFVCWVLEKVGMGSTNSRAARSYEKWGVSTKHDPWPGDIVVFWRGRRDGWQGHVGFLVKKEGNTVYVLGGNQSNSVNVTAYTTDRLVDIRRSSLHRKLADSEVASLYALANKIKAGQKVSLDQTVV